MIKLLIVIALIVVIYMCMSGKYSRDGYQDSLEEGCKRTCFQRHPDAARMYADEDNDVAMTTIDKCIAECKNIESYDQPRGCTSCL